MITDLGIRLVEVCSIDFEDGACFSLMDGNERLIIINIRGDKFRKIISQNHITFLEVHCFSRNNSTYAFIVDKYIPKDQLKDAACNLCINNEVTRYLQQMPDEVYHLRNQ